MRSQREPAQAGSGCAARPSAGESLSRSEILRRQAHVEFLLRSGKRVGGRALSLLYVPQREPAVTPDRRVVFLVSRQTGDAVVRNRLKRQLREIYRRHKHWFPRGYDYALLAAPRAARLGFAQLLDYTRELTEELDHDRRPA